LKIRWSVDVSALRAFMFFGNLYPVAVATGSFCVGPSGQVVFSSDFSLDSSKPSFALNLVLLVHFVDLVSSVELVQPSSPGGAEYKLPVAGATG
jgi:hypothetical protein